MYLLLTAVSWHQNLIKFSSPASTNLYTLSIQGVWTRPVSKP